MIPIARPALSPLVIPCGGDSGTAVESVFDTWVADAARKEVDAGGIVYVNCSERTELESGRESEEDCAEDVKIELNSED